MSDTRMNYDDKAAERETGLWGAALLIIAIWILVVGIGIGLIWLVTRI